MVINNQITELQANKHATIDNRIRKQIEVLILEKEAIMNLPSE
jgi:hypothetical protein